jgi:hypothetical protein
MRKLFVIFIVAAMVLSLATPQGECRGQMHPSDGQTMIKNLYTELEDIRGIRIYVADVIDNSGGEMKGMLADAKKAIEDAFASRMSLDFKIVNSEADADLIIIVKVEERIWLDHDPIDSDKGIGFPATLADAALDEDYARIQADVIVKKGPNASRDVAKALRRLHIRGDIVWEKKVTATVTKMEMTEEASKPLIEERLAHIILRKCFGKKNRV